MQSKNEVSKKTIYDELDKKVNAIQTTDIKQLLYNTRIFEIENKILDHDHDKFITTQEFNKLTADSFAARLAQANLATKVDIAR